MLKMRETEALGEYVALAPLVEQMVSQVVGVPPDSIRRDTTGEARAMPGWSVFEDEEGRGIALNLQQADAATTALQRHFDFFQQTAVIARAVKALSNDAELYLRDGDCCPLDWASFRLEVDTRTIGCAVSSPPPRLIPHGGNSTLKDMMVMLPITAQCRWDGAAVVGQSRAINTLHVTLGQGDATGVLYQTKGGDMTIRVEALESGQSSDSRECLPVKIDLGEVRLSLDQLMAVRRGMELSLDAELPLRCYMRVGTTAIAEAILEPDASGIRLTIVDVCDAETGTRGCAVSRPDATFPRVVSNS